MWEKLEAVEKRYEDLERRLADEELARNPKALRDVAKEHSDLGDLVRTFREWKEVHGEIEGNRALLDDEDPDMRELARSGLESLEAREREIEAELRRLLVPKDPNDERNVILEIRAGTGGDEAALFAAELFRMYSRYAERRRWKIEVLSTSETGMGGIKEIVALVSGEKAYSRLKFESGVHRVQRVPETEASGRIHTSAVTVAVMPEADAVDVEIDDNDLRIDVMRASGPGGQSVNTTDSAVRITHLPSGIVVSCRDEKSQHKNKAKGMKILYARLLERAQQEQHSERAAARKSLVGSGDRSERIRTYNFPQTRVTDHRINLTAHNLPEVLDGDLDALVDALTTEHQASAMEEAAT